MSFIILENTKKVHKIAKLQQNKVETGCKDFTNTEVPINLEMRLKQNVLSLTSIADN